MSRDATPATAMLAVRELQPWISLALKSVSAVAAALALAFVFGAIDYRSAQRLATALGPLPMLLAIPAAWQRARRGDRIGLYMLVVGAPKDPRTNDLAAWAKIGYGASTVFGIFLGVIALVLVGC